jgi:AraC-like DNA-binding protein
MACWGRYHDAARPASVKDPVVDRFEIETLGLELLSRCLRVLRSASSPPKSATRLRRQRAVERVREAVTVAPANPWCIASRATIANLSPFHLCHVLRELVGTSIYEYVLRERLAQTFYDVLEGGDDITAIALDTGFSSRSHLTAPFRRFFGCTPGEASQLRKIMTAVRGDLG